MTRTYPFDEDDEAVCTQVGEWLFFSTSRADQKKARDLCNRCESEEKCREWALMQDVEVSGVFGGTMPGERRAIRRQRRSNSAEKGTNDSSD